MIEAKDKIAIVGIIATFIIAAINLIYMVINNRQTTFVNTVTSSRLKWIESLRDKISTFIAVIAQILSPELASKDSDVAALLRERDTLMHQIILHLNPHDAEDQAIQQLIEKAVTLSRGGTYGTELQTSLLDLRNATQAYLKKEWTRVKQESGGRRQS